VADKLVATGVAAKELGISRMTLVRWWQAGIVKPKLITAGGHARWNMTDLQRQLDEYRRLPGADD